MAGETENIKLKIIEDSDPAAQDLINANTAILETELSAMKGSLSDVNTIKDDLDQAEADIVTLSGRITNNTHNISAVAGDLAALTTTVEAKEDKAKKGQPDGFASLDAAGRVPISQLPIGVKEIRVVANIAARNAITGDELYDGLRVHVLDATGDATVESGWAEYVYSASASIWVKIAEKESMDVVTDWSNVQNIPAVLKALSVINGALAYSGAVVNLDTRVMCFIGGESELPYPWNGTIQQIQISCSEAKTEALTFSVERQLKADYIAKAANWQLIGGSQLVLPAGEVYKEFAVTGTVQSGDVIRASTVGDDTGVTFQVIIKNT
ncbi:hypothetical protein [Anaerospora sp.]|uniref:hypothetical protein n=1 Tax=Anaerospora sp. TaxID=1960278 RepID=UPI002898B5B5|nr:hypothetical protein [Anaerospora sp.]